MFIRINTKCPHCKNSTALDVEVTNTKKIAGVYHCPPVTDGGCDKDFVLYASLELCDIQTVSIGEANEAN